MPVDEQVEAEEWVVFSNLKLLRLHLFGQLARHASPRDLLIHHIYSSLHLYVFARIRLVLQNEVIRICAHLFCYLSVLRIVDI